MRMSVPSSKRCVAKLCRSVWGVARLAKPATIISRCMPLRFRLLPDPAVRSLLGESKGLSAEALDFAVRFARGRASLELRERAAPWLAIREELIAALARPAGREFAELMDKSTKWAASEDWRFVLRWLETWFRDLAVLGGATGQAPLINLDREEALRAASIKNRPLAPMRRSSPGDQSKGRPPDRIFTSHSSSRNTLRSG